MTTVTDSELKAMQKNYKHMLRSPVVKKLNKKISKLKEENRILNRLIIHLGKTIEQKEVFDLTEDSDNNEEHIIYSIEEKSPKHILVKKEEPDENEVNKWYFGREHTRAMIEAEDEEEEDEEEDEEEEEEDDDVEEPEDCVEDLEGFIDF